MEHGDNNTESWEPVLFYPALPEMELSGTIDKKQRWGNSRRALPRVENSCNACPTGGIEPHVTHIYQYLLYEYIR